MSETNRNLSTDQFDLSDDKFNVRVHGDNEWPFTHLASKPYRTARVLPDTPVHTTQRAVWSDVVEAKGEGQDKPVTVALHPVEGGHQIWLVDGHHTLAAARLAGREVPAEVHRRGYDPVEPPHLQPR